MLCCVLISVCGAIFSSHDVDVGADFRVDVVCSRNFSVGTDDIAVVFVVIGGCSDDGTDVSIDVTVVFN